MLRRVLEGYLKKEKGRLVKLLKSNNELRVVLCILRKKTRRVTIMALLGTAKGMYVDVPV